MPRDEAKRKRRHFHRGACDEEQEGAPPAKTEDVLRSLMALNPPPKRVPPLCSPRVSLTARTPTSFLAESERGGAGHVRVTPPTTPTSRGPGSTTSRQHLRTVEERALAGDTFAEEESEGQKRRTKRVKRTVANVTTRRVSRERKTGSDGGQPAQQTDDLTKAAPVSGADGMRQINYDVTGARLRGDEETDMSRGRSTSFSGKQSLFTRIRHANSISPSPTPPDAAAAAVSKDAAGQVDWHTPERLCAPGYAHRRAVPLTGPSTREPSAQNGVAHSPTRLTKNTTKPGDNGGSPAKAGTATTSTSALHVYASPEQECVESTSPSKRYARQILAPVEVNLVGRAGLPPLRPSSRATRDCEDASRFGAPSTDRLFSVDPSLQSQREGGGKATRASSTSRIDQRVPLDDPSRQCGAKGRLAELIGVRHDHRSCSTLCPPTNATIVTTATDTDGSVQAMWRPEGTAARPKEQAGHGADRRMEGTANGVGDCAEHNEKKPSFPQWMTVCVKVFAASLGRPMGGPHDARSAHLVDPRDEALFVVSLPDKISLTETTCGCIVDQLRDRLHFLLPATASLEGHLQLTAADNASSPAAPFLLPMYRCAPVALLPESRLGDYFDVAGLATVRGVDASRRPLFVGSLDTLVLRWISMDGLVAKRLSLERETSPQVSTAPTLLANSKSEETSSSSGSGQRSRPRHVDPLAATAMDRHHVSDQARAADRPARTAEQPTLALSHRPDVSRGRGGELSFRSSGAGSGRPGGSETGGRRILGGLLGAEDAEESPRHSESDGAESVEVIRMSVTPPLASLMHASSARSAATSSSSSPLRPHRAAAHDGRSPPPCRLVDHIVERCEETQLCPRQRWKDLHQAWPASPHRYLSDECLSTGARRARRSSNAVDVRSGDVAAAPSAAARGRREAEPITFLFTNGSSW